MSRINANISSLLAQTLLPRQNEPLSTSMERPSIGLRINRGSDNPARRCAGEKLRSEKTAIAAAVANAQRTNQAVNIAGGGLREIGNMLLQVQDLVDQSANRPDLRPQEKQANQLQIDSILQSIDRLASTTSFQGAQLLNGSYAFTLTGGGAQFAPGPNVDIQNQASPGLMDLTARNLGDATHGCLSSLASGDANNLIDGNPATARNIVHSAIDQVSALRGRLGAFQQNVVGATIDSLGVALENTHAAENSIRDADFAVETAKLTRSQILVNAATQVLRIADSPPQNALKLLPNA